MRNIRLPFAISMVFLILLHCASYCEAEKNHECPPTSCGSITNIKYPFRLRGDPKNCGHSSYELACENNRTILYPASCRFFVQSISYNNFTIRVLDPGLEKTSCASFHINTLYSLAPYYPLELSTPIIYIHCEAPAKSPFYVDTRICSKNISLQKYSYHVVGDGFSVADLEDSCSIDTMAWTSKEFPIVNNASCSEIQDGLAYGINLRWYRVYCHDECGAKLCHIEDDNTIRCDNSYCEYPGERTNCTLSFWSQSWLDLQHIWRDYHTPLEIILGFFAARFFFGILFLFTLLAYKFRRRHLSMYDSIEEFLQTQNNFMPIRYSYRDLKNMTKNFKDKLGEGGYGIVFKGQLRSGPFVAIKLMGNPKLMDRNLSVKWLPLEEFTMLTWFDSLASVLKVQNVL